MEWTLAWATGRTVGERAKQPLRHLKCLTSLTWINGLASAPDQSTTHLRTAAPSTSAAVRHPKEFFCRKELTT